MKRLVQFRARYGPHVLLAVAVLLAIVVPQETRNAAWGWLLKGLNVMDVIAVFGVYKVLSSTEHVRSEKKIDGISEKLENGLKESLNRIERRLGIDE